MTIEKFEKLVEQGIKDIPEKFLKKLVNVEIVVEENPSSEQLLKLKIRKNMLLFGLYEGVPQTKRWGYGQVLPDKITIFKKPIEQAAQSDEEIKKIVKECDPLAKIYLYGSRAKGTARSDSDWDLIILLTKEQLIIYLP